MADNPVLQRFERNQLTDAADSQISDNTAAYRTFAQQVLAMAPAGRELSNALDALEEAKFWTNQAVALAGAIPAEPLVTEPTELETRDA